MPLQLDGQLTLSSAPTVGSSGPKRAMLVRLTEDSLDALSAELGAGKYPPVQFDFSGTPVCRLAARTAPARSDPALPCVGYHNRRPVLPRARHTGDGSP